MSPEPGAAVFSSLSPNTEGSLLSVEEGLHTAGSWWLRRIILTLMLSVLKASRQHPLLLMLMLLELSLIHCRLHALGGSWSLRVGRDNIVVSGNAASLTTHHDVKTSSLYLSILHRMFVRFATQSA